MLYTHATHINTPNVCIYIYVGVYLFHPFHAYVHTFFQLAK